MYGQGFLRPSERCVFQWSAIHGLRTAARKETSVREIPIVWNAENGHFEDMPSKSAQQSTYSVPGTRPESRSLDTLPISESTVLSE